MHLLGAMREGTRMFFDRKSHKRVWLLPCG
jgi:hypothetical protein